MTRHRPGFTLVEGVIVLIIAGVLIAMTLPQIARMQSRRGVANARDAYVLLSMRARSAAIEHGRLARLTIEPSAARAFVHVGTDTLAIVRYEDEYTATVQSSTGGTVTLCYSPRGFAMPGCTTITEPATIVFTRGSEQARARVAPLGQVGKL